MKTVTHLLFGLLTCLLSMHSVAAQSKQAVLKGTVLNSPASYVSISFVEDNLSLKTRTTHTYLKEGGVFEIELPVYEPKTVQAIIGGRTLDLFVQPGSELILNWDYNDGEEALAFEGASAADNVLFRELLAEESQSSTGRSVMRGYLEFESQQEILDLIEDNTALEFMELMDARELAAIQSLEANTDVSPGFIANAKRNIRFEHLKNRLTLFAENRYSLNFGQEVFDKMDTVLTGFSMSDADNLTSENFLQAAAFFLDYNLLKRGRKVGALSVEYFDNSAAFFSDEVRYALQTKMLLNSLRSGDRSLAKLRYVDFVEQNPFWEFTALIEADYGSKLRFLPGAKAPDFVVRTETDLLSTLSEYRGKVVYLKFWASWCAPCIADFNKESKFRRQLEREGVVLLNVSMDKSDAMWQQAIEKFHIDGTNVVATDIDFLRDKYNFETLPVGFYIDPDGGFARLSGDKTVALEQIRTLASSAAAY